MRIIHTHRAIHVSLIYGGPAHIKLVAEWEPDTKAGVFGSVPDLIPQPHDSVGELRELYQSPLETSLRDCLKIYTREETVGHWCKTVWWLRGRAFEGVGHLVVEG